MSNNVLVFLLGVSAGTLCTLSFIPQVIRIYRLKDAKDISLLTFSIFSVGVSIWFIYGIIIGQWPIIIANALTLLLALAIVIMKLKFK